MTDAVSGTLLIASIMFVFARKVAVPMAILTRSVDTFATRQNLVTILLTSASTWKGPSTELLSDVDHKQAGKNGIHIDT